MRCDEVRALVSAAADGELPAADRAVLERELEQCPDCRRFAAHVEELRTRLRFEALDRVPDLVPAVLDRIDDGNEPVEVAGPQAVDAGRGTRPRRSGWLVAAAALVAGLVAGAVLVGVTREPQAPVAALDVPKAVLEAQSTVESLSAEVRMTERGWHPDVPVRSYAGTIQYSGPESLAVKVTDLTQYPSSEWPSNDVTMVGDAGLSWTSALRPCPRETQPGCSDAEPRVTAVDDREPFPDATPLALDLVIPVQSFRLAASTPVAGTGQIDGRDAVRVDITVAQAQPMLDGILSVGNWRALHPTDLVALWLDAEAMIPLRLTVEPSSDPDRREWAARRGYADAPGEPILDIELFHVVTGAPVDPASFPPLPSEASVRTAGFVDDPAVARRFAPEALPTDMRLVRAGTTSADGAPNVHVASWSDGRAWLKVRATDDWTSNRLFGGLGTVVRPVDIGEAGIGYANEAGTKVAVHADDLDLVVTGSVTEADLRSIAGSLGVVGRPVPASWPEAASTPVSELRALVPDLLVPEGLDGFGPATASMRDGTATVGYGGPGERGFVVVQVPGAGLGPPLDVDAREVLVRGLPGRWNPALGTLEWEEAGSALSLSSQTLTLHELLDVAARLQS